MALWMVVAVVGISLGLVVLRVGSVEATTHSATRSFSAASVLPGEPLTVTIGASGYDGLGDVLETLVGFEYVIDSSTLSGVKVTATPDGDGQVLSFILAGETSFQYMVVAESEGPYSITGELYKVLQPGEAPAAIENLNTVSVGSAMPVDPTPPTDPDPPPVDTMGPSATRSFVPASAGAGDTVQVTVTASNYGGVGEVVETLVGYEYVRNSSSLSGVDEDGSTLSFILAGEQSFTYSVTVPEVGVEHSITGVVKDILGGTESPVGGSPSVMIEAGVDPMAPSATRSFFPMSAGAGDMVQVTVTASNYGGVGEVVETLVGYEYVRNSSSLSGVDEDGSTLSFILAGEQSFTYSVTVPEMGVEHSIAGVVKDILGEREAPVGGSSSVMAETGVAPSGPMATRSFSPATAPVGSPVRVTITAADYGGVGEVVETLVGYTYIPESSTLFRV